MGTANLFRTEGGPENSKRMVGFGRIVALYRCSSTSQQTHQRIGCLSFWGGFRRQGRRGQLRLSSAPDQQEICMYCISFSVIATYVLEEERISR